MALALLGVVQATLIAAITAIVIPLPAIGRELDASQAGLALVSAAYGLSFSGLLLLGGRLADRLGRRTAFRLGVVLFGLASIGAALAPGLGVLLAARFAQGCGAALAAPAAMALLHTVFPRPDRRARALAIWGGLPVTGATAGTVLSGVVVNFMSWRWGVAAPSVVAAVAVAAAPRLLPPGPPPAQSRLDVPGALLATVGVSGVSAGLVMTGSAPSAAVVALLCGALALAAFFALESRTRAALLPPRFLLSGRRATALVAVLSAAAASAGSMFVLSLYFQQVRGYTPLATSAAFLPFALVVPGGRLAGRLVGRTGPRAITTLGLALAAAGLLLLGRIGPDTPYVGSLLAGLLALPTGMGLALSGTTVAAAADVPESEASLAGAVVNLAMETGPPMGLAVAAALAGIETALLAGTGHGRGGIAAVAAGDGFALTALGIVLVLAAGLVAMVPPRAPRRSSSGETQTRRYRMTRRFEHQVALVTGGGSGIGRGAALALAREGATVVIAGRRPEPLAETVDLIEAEGGEASAVTADVTRDDDLARVVATTVARHGGLHVAINNAGVFAAAPAADLDEVTWSNVLAVNLTGVWLSMKHEIAHMRRHGGGAIVNVASTIGAHVTMPGTAAYAAAKAGVSSLTRAAAQDHIREGVRINAISPGPADTAMSQRPGETGAERAARLQDRLPIGRVGSVDEVVAAAVWLASPEASFVVGHDLVVDGGAAA